MAWAAMLLACLVPMAAFIVVSRGDWILDFRGADNWSYVKYFRDWATTDPILRAEMNGDYKGARVAWILLGYLFYRWLPPVGADAALNLVMAVLHLLLTLVLATRVCGRHAGVLATIVAASYTGYYATGIAGFWSYHGVLTSLLYLLLLLGLAEHATGRASVRAGALVGASAAVLVLTHPTYLIALPAAGLFWLVLRGRPARHAPETMETTQAGGRGGARGSIGHALSGAVREFGPSFTAAALSGLAAVAVLSLGSYLAGGQLLFMRALVSTAVGFSNNPFWAVRAADWFPAAAWIGFPSVVAVGCGLTLAVRWTRGERLPRPGVAAMAGFLTLWGIMWGLEAAGKPFIQSVHVNYMALGPAAIALAAVLRWMPPKPLLSAGGHPALAAVLFAIALTLPQVLLPESAVSAITQALRLPLGGLVLAGGAVGCMLLGGLALGLMAAAPGIRTLLVAGVCLGVAWMVGGPTPPNLGDPPSCGVVQAHTNLVTDVTRWLGGRGWHGHARLWYAPSEQFSMPPGCPGYTMLAAGESIEQAGMVWDIMTEAPNRIEAIDPRDLRNVSERERGALVVLSTPERAAEYHEALLAWGRRTPAAPGLRLAARQTFTHDPLALTVQVYRFR
ncbi:MAG: hypothetical protein IT306_22895 [Chloroflexi bacterium]|nr:hypothetical protein [Chloroflexota bacterium]